MNPRNAYERAAVDCILKELRRSAKLMAPTTIIIDPFYDGTGCYILASSDAHCRRYECTRKGKGKL